MRQMPRRGPPDKDKWAQIGLDLMSGKSRAEVAFKHHVQKRTIDEALKRFKETASLLPGKSGVVKGGKFQHRRKTTAHQDKRVPKLLEAHMGDETEYTAEALADNLDADVHRTTAGRRIREHGYEAHRPRKKEQYSEEDRKTRVAWCKKYKDWTAPQWERTVFMDEHLTVCPSVQTGSRQLFARKRFVYRKKGKDTKGRSRALDPRAVVPAKGKNTKGGTGILLTVAIFKGELLTCAPVADFIRRSTKPKVVPKIFKHGKKLGRKPGANARGLKPRGYDQHAHALFLKETAEAARKKLKATLNTEVWMHQDGLKLHWAPASLKQIEDSNLQFTDKPPTYSPDTNCIENLFSETEDRLHKAFAKEKQLAGKPDAWAKRWATEARRVDIRKLQRSMPERMLDVIEAKGGPTRW